MIVCIQGSTQCTSYVVYYQISIAPYIVLTTQYWGILFSSTIHEVIKNVIRLFGFTKIIHYLGILLYIASRTLLRKFFLSWHTRYHIFVLFPDISQELRQM